MIGGDDIVVDGTTSDADIAVVLRRLLSWWPSGILETDDGHWPLELAATQHWKAPHTSFVYENHDAYESWDRFGLTDENADQMVHIIVLFDSITFVVSERPEAKTQPIAATLVAAVEAERTARSQR